MDACIATLIAHGYDAAYSIEPHVAAIIHTGQGVGDRSMDQVKWDSYLEYGRRLMALYDRVSKAAV